jgi:DNA repair protein RecO (recombination protein O)
MPSYSTQIVVLKKTKLAETDLIITGFSQEGRQVRAVVKGARKPGSKLGAHLELYSVAQVLLHKGRNLDIVTEAQTVISNDTCRRDVIHSAGAAVVVELLDKISSDSVADTRLYPLACEALRCIGAVPDEGVALITAAAILKIAAQSGVRPSLGQCALCGSELIHPVQSIVETENTPDSTLSFSFEQGGIICDLCLPDLTEEGSTFISTHLIEWTEVLITSRFVDLESFADQEHTALGVRLLEFSREWVRFHLVPRIKSLDFLLSFE